MERGDVTTLRGWVPAGVPRKSESRAGSSKRKKKKKRARQGRTRQGNEDEPCKDLVPCHPSSGCDVELVTGSW